VKRQLEITLGVKQRVDRAASIEIDRDRDRQSRSSTEPVRQKSTNNQYRQTHMSTLQPYFILTFTCIPEKLLSPSKRVGAPDLTGTPTGISLPARAYRNQPTGTSLPVKPTIQAPTRTPLGNHQATTRTPLGHSLQQGPTLRTLNPTY
jgi:hypothetical protein